MKHVQMRDAKARLSELVAEVEKGEPVTITRHGAPAAVLVPVDEAEKLYRERTKQKAIIDVLMEFPGDGTEFERDHTPVRVIDLE